MPDGPLTKVAHIKNDGSEVGQSTIELIKSPLRIFGPFPFLREMAQAGLDGRNQHYQIRRIVAGIKRTSFGGITPKYTYRLALGFVGGDSSVELGQPVECQTNVQ